MADERIETAEGEIRSIWAWTELFRTFQVALDPKKLVFAAAGILITYIGWWLLAVVFFDTRSVPRENRDIKGYTERYGISEQDAQQRISRDYEVAKAEFAFLEKLAGPNGKLRVAPWDEDRGPNPFLLATGQLEDRPWEGGKFWDWALTQQLPVLIEPLVKFLRPVVGLLHPLAGGWTRVYLLLVTFWTLATWAFFGGAITRLAAVQLAGKDRPGLMETVRFVAARYVSYLSAPLVPLAFIALIVVLMILYGLIHLIPFVGDIADSIAWPILMLLGFGQAILLIGLVGYPLMYATVSAEGSDTFDALSRSYNYVFQSPWNYIWYALVAVAYGAVLVFFVGFMGSFVIYLTKWSLSQTPLSEYFVTRRVDNLFVYAPRSFHWNELLVSGPTEMTWYNQISAVIVGAVWTTLVFLIVLGFGYSYYFSAFTMIYYLMRRKVDDTEMDEVYLEEDEDEEPLLPPAPPAHAPSGPGTPLQMVEPPALRTPSPPTADGPGATPPAEPERPPEGATPAS
jgi:hypothetical protein